MADGTVEIVEDDAVKIDGIFYHLSGNVKAEFLRPGKCEYSIGDDGESVTFVKMDKSEPKQRTFGKNKPKPTSNNDSQFRDPAEIIREGCLNAAVNLAAVNKENGAIASDQIIKNAKKFENYVIGKVEAKPE